MAEYINRLLKIPASLPQLLANRVALATNKQTIGALSLRVVEEHYNLGNDLYMCVFCLLLAVDFGIS